MSERGGELLAFEDGERVFGPGEAGECLYLVLCGGVSLRTEGALVATVGSDLGPGAVCGRFGGGADALHAVSAVAVGRTDVVRYDKESLIEAASAEPELAFGIISALADQLSRASDQLQELSNRYVLDRTEMALIERAVLEPDVG